MVFPAILSEGRILCLHCILGYSNKGFSDWISILSFKSQKAILCFDRNGFSDPNICGCCSAGAAGKR